jgi:uncharacterized protein
MSEASFDSNGTRCVATHLEGRGTDFSGADGRRPCVVLGHGFGCTVDSGLLPYAEAFAAAGLDALAFDYRSFGRSDGEPRQVLSIPGQLEDYAAAIAHARTLPSVDPDRIVAWGTSFAGGHVVPVAVEDGRVAAVISQTPAMDGLATTRFAMPRVGVRGMNRLTVAALRDIAGARRGRPPVTIGVVGPADSLAAMTTPDAQPKLEAMAGPTFRNEVAARIGLSLGMYRPGRRAGELPCPILIQIADHDDIAPPAAAMAAAWEATGRAEVRTYPISHFDIYVGEPFTRAVAHQLYFLRRHLGARQPAEAAAVSA